MAASYCGTYRDVYVSRVLGVKGEDTPGTRTGKAIHEAVYAALTAYIKGSGPEPFEPGQPEGVDAELVRMAYSYTAAEASAAIARQRAMFPGASEEDVRTSAMPFLLEHRIDGSRLGLSDQLAIDAFDFMRRIVFDLKYLRPGSRPEPWRRLYVAGYALVLEGAYEVPVDVGCIVYVSRAGSGMRVKRDIFFIDDELRGWWVEMRDRKLEIAASGADPGLPKACYGECPYRAYCLRGRLG